MVTSEKIFISNETARFSFLNGDFHQQVAGFSLFPNANLPKERLVCQDTSFSVCRKLAKANLYL